MKKHKHLWPVILIAIVIALTIYNILPTVFYYQNALSRPIDQRDAQLVAEKMVKRVHDLDNDAHQWLQAFCKNLGIKKYTIKPYDNDPQLVLMTFSNAKDAQQVRHTLPRAGALIPFAPAQLALASQNTIEPHQVLIQRRIGIDATQEGLSQYFTFSPKTENGEIAPFYKNWALSRMATVSTAVAGETSQAQWLHNIMTLSQKPSLIDRELLVLAREIVDFEKTFGDKSPFAKRYFAQFSQIAAEEKDKLISQFQTRLSDVHNLLAKEIVDLKSLQASLEKQGKYLDANLRKQLQAYITESDTIEAALLIVKRNTATLSKGKTPLTYQDALAKLEKSTDDVISLNLGYNNPYVQYVKLNWEREVLALELHSDVLDMLNAQPSSEEAVHQQERLHQLVINEIARIAKLSHENLSPIDDAFIASINGLTDSRSMLALDLKYLAQSEVAMLKKRIDLFWEHSSPNFQPNNFPVSDFASYTKLSSTDQKLGLLIYSPLAANDQKPLDSSFRPNSVYIIAKGLKALIDQYKQYPNSSEAKEFEQDFRNLHELLRQSGFQLAYSGASLPKEFHQDYIFEYPDFYGDALAATREQFIVKGDQRYAVLEFTNVEQRLLTLNKIETQIHEELLKWRDDYRAAQVDLDLNAKLDIPKPTKNVYLSNLLLSAKKYFRGDNRKIIKWGIDLAGGKTLVIGLKDQNNKPVTNKIELTQGLNEITQRINKLGLAEIAPRIEGNHIVVDFPSSQNISAQELIQASTMSFHIVNEAFTPANILLADAVNQFLQDVWNEAVITNRKDPESVNAIAWKYLGGIDNSMEIQPRSEYAKLLYENGLRLAPPGVSISTSAFDDTVSTIGIFEGEDFTAWQGQTTPLMVLFKNKALEGSDLENVRTGYDPSKGNVLYFGVRSSYTNSEGEKVNPRELLYSWTMQYSQEKIAGTPKEKFGYKGGGWRMAVVLNGSIINTPSLTSPLRDNIEVRGAFTQNEINKLAADLKAGSLSYSPQILSEENISPELGHKERDKGIIATFVALVLVVLVMVGYYRFAGIIASIAVLFNLLIMWGTLQNLQATLTLAGIAAIILTMGMAVDANVLVFERIREEYAISKRLSSAIATGYRKAFSAIIDSNITTIIAALILLNFDAGPIKAFAITITIGIVSSMFTALYMTKTFFTRWVQKGTNKTLSMANLVKVKSFDFVKRTKLAMAIALIVIVGGGAALYMQKHTIFGMDFTGGYSFSVNLTEKPGVANYREVLAKSLMQEGLSSGDYQIQELGKANHLRMQFSYALNQKGQPFFNMPQQTHNTEITYDWESNPRLLWVAQVIEKAGLTINPSMLPTLNNQWSEMSGQLSKTIRNNAIYGLTLAFICILLYITFRFEFTFALSAILCLLHDVFFTVALIAIIHLFGVHIQINLQVIAALMTIIGYSLNDTIIVFDRIREEIKISRRMKLTEIINHSLRVTLNRTLMTSTTTFVVLLALVVLGGPQILDFSLVMALGVVFGTLSSLFIAPGLLLYFSDKARVKSQTV